MKISTNNSRDFKKNSITDIIEEQNNSICHIEIPEEPFGYPEKIGFKNTKIFEEIKTNPKTNENISNLNLIFSVELNEIDVSKKKQTDLFITLKELVFKNEDTVKKTLPGLIISIMIKNNNFVTEDSLIDIISPIMGDLRKPDGSKYKGNPFRVIKSALSSSGMFEKCEEKEIADKNLKKEKSHKKLESEKDKLILLEASDNETKSFDDDYKLETKKNLQQTWTVKAKEAMQYLSRTIDKFQMKIIEKEKKMEEKQQIMLGKKTRNNTEEKKEKNDQLKNLNLKMEEMENKLIDLQKNLIDTCKMED